MSVPDPSCLEAGQFVEGKGVYVGTWEPVDGLGRTLGRIFDIYAAPTDVKSADGDLSMTFNEAVCRVAGLQNWHGHNGVYIYNEKALLIAARENPALLSNWFIPSKEILHGADIKSQSVQPANLYDNRAVGAFEDSFVTGARAGWYWSCTDHENNFNFAYLVRFLDGFDYWNSKSENSFSCRPVRAELRP